MPWDFDNKRPIYLQLVDAIQLKIVSGEYAPGMRLPSVRDMATEAGVNPNTMQRALSQLENDCLLFTERTNGRFVTEDIHTIDSLRNKLAEGYVRFLWENLQQMGFTPDIALQLIRKIIKGDEKENDRYSDM